MDLFEPGSGDQIHDINGGIPPSGLFWTVPLPRRAFKVSRDFSRATLHVRDLPLIDTFQFMSPNDTPATVSFKVKWEASGPEDEYGSGSAVEPTDPAAFLGRFRHARAEGTFSGTELGFSFESLPGATTDATFAELGSQRNGVFLSE